MTDPGVILQADSVNSLSSLLQPERSGIYELELILLTNYKFIFDSKSDVAIDIRQEVVPSNCKRFATLVIFFLITKYNKKTAGAFYSFILFCFIESYIVKKDFL